MFHIAWGNCGKLSFKPTRYVNGNGYHYHWLGFMLFYAGMRPLFMK